MLPLSDSYLPAGMLAKGQMSHLLQPLIHMHLNVLQSVHRQLVADAMENLP